jgi:PPOX class probable F420-dependent enzyme
MTPDEARKRFAAASVARLATVDPDGHPHVVPVVFAVLESFVYIAVDHKPKTSRDLRRLRNIRTTPAVSVLVDHYEDEWTRLWWARADGSATVVDDPAAMTTPIDLLVAKYPQYQESRPSGPVIAIEVTRWTGWSFSDSDEPTQD